jgi:hypothetical protein
MVSSRAFDLGFLLIMVPDDEIVDGIRKQKNMVVEF